MSKTFTAPVGFYAVARDTPDLPTLVYVNPRSFAVTKTPGKTGDVLASAIMDGFDADGDEIVFFFVRGYWKTGGSADEHRFDQYAALVRHDLDRKVARLEATRGKSIELMDQPALRGVVVGGEGGGRLLVDTGNPWFSIAEVVGGPRVARATVSTVDDNCAVTDVVMWQEVMADDAREEDVLARGRAFMRLLRA